jgi:hypothetical protein
MVARPFALIATFFLWRGPTRARHEPHNGHFGEIRNSFRLRVCGLDSATADISYQKIQLAIPRYSLPRPLIFGQVMQDEN